VHFSFEHEAMRLTHLDWHHYEYGVRVCQQASRAFLVERSPASQQTPIEQSG
jgi:hypothetical protein